jgi:hypothetical protein
VGPRAVLDAVVKRKIPSPLRDSNPRIPILQPVAHPTPIFKTIFQTEFYNLIFYFIMIGSGTHPASYPMGTKGNFSGGKAAGARN